VAVGSVDDSEREDGFDSNSLVPSAHPTLAAFGEVFANDFGRYLPNSAVVTVSAVAILLAVSVMAAYVVVRNRSWASRRVFQLILEGLAIPGRAPAPWSAVPVVAPALGHFYGPVSGDPVDQAVLLVHTARPPTGQVAR
jgi:ABC-type Fe3+ transport system permease subunit